MPLWRASRIATGRQGVFDLEELCKKNGLPKLKDVNDGALYDKVLDFFPRMLFVGLPDAWTSREGFLMAADVATQELVRGPPVPAARPPPAQPLRSRARDASEGSLSTVAPTLRSCSPRLA